MGLTVALLFFAGSFGLTSYLPHWSPAILLIAAFIAWKVAREIAIWALIAIGIGWLLGFADPLSYLHALT